MARTFLKPNVGATGMRRIVPIMGIDFIAGQIQRKGELVQNHGAQDYPYGVRSASIGGRTRRWSSVNFLNVRTNFSKALSTAEQTANRDAFKRATDSMRATLQNLAVISYVNADFLGTNLPTRPAQQTRAGVNANDYATIRGWVTAVRMAQIAAGDEIESNTNTWF